MKSFPRSASVFCSLLFACCAAFPADKPVGTGPSFQGPLGLQLYSLRGEFIRNVPATLQKVKRYGFGNVELAGTYNLSAEKFKGMLDANQLDPVSGHFPFER